MKFLLLAGVVLAAAALLYGALHKGPSASTEKEAFNFDSLPQYHHLPPLLTFKARDGEILSYCLYGHSDRNLMLLLHGSSGHGANLDGFAKKMAQEATVCVPTARGHCKSGSKPGTCSYVGQLEDDLADLLNHLNAQNYQFKSMVGFSSGGSLAIRFSGGKYGNLVDCYALLAPVVPAYKPLTRQGSNWVRVNYIRIPLLVIANMLGLTCFNQATVITFNRPRSRNDGTETLSYSYNLLFSMNPRFDYLQDIASIDGRSIVIGGRNDECLIVDAYKDLFKKSPIYIFDDLNHFALVSDPRVLEKVREFCIR